MAAESGLLKIEKIDSNLPVKRATRANRRTTIQTIFYNNIIQTLGGVDWKPGDTGICWLI